MRRRIPLSHLSALARGQPMDPRRYKEMLPWLQESGARGAPLPAERPFVIFKQGTTQAITPEIPPGPEQQPSLTTIFPWLFAPLESFPIVTASAIVAVGAGATVTLISMAELGRGYAGVINAFGTTAADFTDLFWSFVIKGRFIQPIIELNFQFGLINDPKALPGAGVLLNPGDDFNVQVRNAGGAPVAAVQARVEGYYWRIGGL